MQKWGLEILSLSSLIVDVPTVVCLKFKTFLPHYVLGWSDLVLFVIFENEQFLEVIAKKILSLDAPLHIRVAYLH